MTTTERWREIPDLPGFKISDRARVSSPAGRILTPLNRPGLDCVAIHRPGGCGKTTRSIPKLMASVGFPYPPEKPEPVDVPKLTLTVNSVNGVSIPEPVPALGYAQPRTGELPAAPKRGFWSKLFGGQRG